MTLCHSMDCPWNLPAQNTGVGSLSLLQGIFPIQRSNPCLLHCRWILYQLSHKGSPRILEWVAYPFSSSSSRPRNWTRVSCITSGFFTNWAIREAPWMGYLCPNILICEVEIISIPNDVFKKKKNHTNSLRKWDNICGIYCKKRESTINMQKKILCVDVGVNIKLCICIHMNA